MLSAKSGKIRYISGNIPDPKSREYQCIHCDDKVFHISGHRRSASERVAEHFRHQKNASHPIRSMSKMQGDAIEFIIDKLSREYEIELFTDQIYSTARGDIPTDILAREHYPDGSHLDTLIQVEANPSNYQDFLALHSKLSSDDIYMMPVLCAQGSKNSNGKFFRDEYRQASRTTVKNLRKNEKALYERFRRGIYFDHDTRALKIVKYHDYVEELQEDIISGGYRIKQAGEIVAFELKKEVEVIKVINERFKFKRFSVGEKKIAFPRLLNIEDAIQKELLAKERDDEDAIEEHAERVAIMFENCSEEKLKELTEEYGEEFMGGYAVE